MRDAVVGKVEGGVSPSSDLTSWIEKFTDAKSSTIPSKELTEFRAALLGCDHTALRCSGSGARTFPVSLLKEDLPQDVVVDG